MFGVRVISPGRQVDVSCATLISGRTNALHAGIALIAVVCAVFFCVWFRRRNWLAYALVLWLFALRGPLLELLGNGNPSLDMQGWIVAAVAAATIIWAILPGFGRTASPVLEYGGPESSSL